MSTKQMATPIDFMGMVCIECGSTRRSHLTHPPEGHQFEPVEMPRCEPYVATEHVPIIDERDVIVERCEPQRRRL